MRNIVRIMTFAVIVCGFYNTPSASREPDGTLGLIRTPNNGIPAIILSTEPFTAVCTEKSILSLAWGEQTFPLEADWTLLPNGLLQARCTASAPLPAGVYSLNASTTEHTDCNTRAVYVMDTFPDTYTIAHVTDVHTGTQRHSRKDTEIIADVINAVNESDATIAVITGDLTDNGDAEQFRSFLAVLDAFRMPTFVVSGNHDRQARNYELFFGLQTYAFRFGKDGYLAYDTKDFIIADDYSEQNGLLQYYRRALRSSRWSIGLTHRYDLSMGIRAQLILFVDDPLDYVLYGHYHREAGEQDGIPWGKTKIIMTPAAINGMFRLIMVNEQGLHPQESVQAASIKATGTDLPPTDSTRPNPAQ